MQKLSSLENESKYIIISNNNFLSDRLKEAAQEDLEQSIERTIETLGGSAVDDYSFRCCDLGRGINFIINADHRLFCQALMRNTRRFRFISEYIGELDNAIGLCSTDDEISETYNHYGLFLSKLIVLHMEHLMSLLEIAFETANRGFRHYVDKLADNLFDRIYIHDGHILEVNQLAPPHPTWIDRTSAIPHHPWHA